MKQHAGSLELLLRGLRAALLTLDSGNPNRRCLEEAIGYTERSRRGGLGASERAALLRTAAAHLRQADIATTRTAENELLGAVRRAMTAVLFEYTSSGSAEPPHDDSPRSLSPLASESASPSAIQETHASSV